MMNIFHKLVEWFNTAATLSYEDVVFIYISTLS